MASGLFMTDAQGTDTNDRSRHSSVLESEVEDRDPHHCDFRRTLLIVGSDCPWANNCTRQF
jgi:hypothetical protein